jgi:hypothetical protein
MASNDTPTLQPQVALGGGKLPRHVLGPDAQAWHGHAGRDTSEAFQLHLVDAIRAELVDLALLALPSESTRIMQVEGAAYPWGTGLLLRCWKRRKRPEPAALQGCPVPAGPAREVAGLQREVYVVVLPVEAPAWSELAAHRRTS